MTRGTGERSTVASVYRRRAPTLWYAVMFATLGGVSLALSHWVLGAVLISLAIACSVADHFDDADSSGLYP